MTETSKPATPAPDLSELGPLARVIADKVSTVPVRHCLGGTDDLVSALTLAVAVYVGRHVLPVEPVAAWIAAGARDLSIPEQRPDADEEQTLRWTRRESLLVLLSRLQRGRTLSEEEAGTLRHHVETEMREADTARAVAAGNKRHVQVMYAELQQAKAALDGTEQPPYNPEV